MMGKKFHKITISKREYDELQEANKRLQLLQKCIKSEPNISRNIILEIAQLSDE
ncbi:MAG: hypothetical protein V8R80_02100 [Eubacterium sp.]